MDPVNKKKLESLINKPRAFRNVSFIENAPVRRTMILLGSESPNTFETPRNYRRIIESRKAKKNEPLF